MSKELQQIIRTIADQPVGTPMVLATVVDVRGSGYRLPGARMLICKNGETFGTVSGGCLEADVMERARKVLKSGRAELFVYDTTADENSVFSLNMGCRGVMRILLEPVGPNSELISAIRTVWNDRQKITVATYIGGAVEEKIDIGCRIFVGNNETLSVDRAAIFKTVPGIDDDLLTLHESSAAYETMRYVNERGEAEFAFESLVPPVQLLILGAGADAVPMARTAYDLGWQVRVYDHRPAFLTHERFPDAEEIKLTDRENTGIDGATDERTAIVAMNHNYDRDKESIAAALRTKAFYIGALGPKKRTEQILDELRTRGEELSADALARLRYPAGLDIGADTPESIAISIVAESQSVLKHRPASPLHDRDGSIYDRK